MEERQVEEWKDVKNMEETQVGWIVKWYGKYGRKASRIAIRYGQYGRKAY
jgi:hypothetical protein